MKNKAVWKKILSEVYHYLLFFLLVAFLISCTMTLFVSTLSKDLNLTLTDEHLNRAAKLTFLNVVLLSVLFTVIDTLRRKLTTDRVTKSIATATRNLVQGKFETRIAPVSKIGISDNYHEIIHCFNKIAQELGSLENLRTDFIANVSHEMKTPLSVIQNYGTLLQVPNLPDEKRMEYARSITDCSRRMSDMITNILKLNRLENQQIYPQRTDFDLGEQLCEYLLQYEQVWEAASISVETELECNITVHADKDMLGVVWNNLFSNAFKFTSAGGTVSVRLYADSQYAVVRVQDTGCGMNAEVGRHIFEKFYQGDTSHAVQGNGLGLALVKRVMDILKGEISVESKLGEGTTFTIKIRRN